MRQIALLGDRPWVESSDPLLKQLILFFDGFATALPEFYFNELLSKDPILAGPLYSGGRLLNYPPAAWIGDQVAREVIDELLWLCYTSARHESTDVDPSLISDPMLRALAEDLRRTAALAALSQWAGADQNDLRTSQSSSSTAASVARFLPAAVGADVLHPLMNRPLPTPVPTSVNAEVIQCVRLDVEVVTPDLTSVPLDEVLDFRSQFADLYSSYSRDLRRDALLLARLSADERELEYLLRSSDLEERAHELGAISRASFPKAATVGVALSAAGAAWTGASGDIWGAILAAASGTISLVDLIEPETSFVLAAKRRWP